MGARSPGPRCARDLMSGPPRTVRPDTTLADLERALLEAGVGGFPVVEGDRLVGVVSRSDVVRQLSVEQSLAELLASPPPEAGGGAPAPDEIAEQVGRRMEALRVRDVMNTEVVTVGADTPLEEVARRLVERHIHRVPVVEEGRLLGVVAALDFVRLVAEGRLRSR